MRVDTYGRWPWGSVALVLPTWSAVVVARAWLIGDGRWVAALALPVLVSHQTEEWVRPGGFLPFCNRDLLSSDRDDWPLTARLAFHVNVTVGWTSAVVGALVWSRTPAVAAAVLWLEAGNAAMHAAMGVTRRRYNPGVVSGVLLMAPHAGLGAVWLARSGRVGRRAALGSAVAGLSGSVLPAMLKLRQRRALRHTSTKRPPE